MKFDNIGAFFEANPDKSRESENIAMIAIPGLGIVRILPDCPDFRNFVRILSGLSGFFRTSYFPYRLHPIIKIFVSFFMEYIV